MGFKLSIELLQFGFSSSSETQGILVGTMRYFRASDIFGRESLFQGLKSPWALFLNMRCRNPFR